MATNVHLQTGEPWLLLASLWLRRRPGQRPGSWPAAREPHFPIQMSFRSLSFLSLWWACVREGILSWLFVDLVAPSTSLNELKQRPQSGGKL